METTPHLRRLWNLHIEWLVKAGTATTPHRRLSYHRKASEAYQEYRDAGGTRKTI